MFGCVAYGHVPDQHRRKLDKKSKKMRFVGYSTTSKGYRLYDEETRKVSVHRDVTFNENDFGIRKYSEVEVDPSSVDVPAVRPMVDPGRPVRHRQPPVRYGLDEYADTAMSSSTVNHLAYHVSEIKEPLTIEEALASDQAHAWKEAADSEYTSLIENETWDLVELPAGRKPIGSKWVFKVKHGSDGRVERFKGRLVARGYTQKYGIDYEETFSPVVRFSSIRSLLAFAVQHEMVIHQMDVVTAFLNGKLEEELYMRQPDGFVRPGEEHLVCKLKKALYGLKQAPRCWTKAFREFIESDGFVQSSADPCVFIRKTDTLAIVAVYVDDLILITKSEDEMHDVKSKLATEFKMKDLGKLHYCLGITIEQDEDHKWLMIHQRHYIRSILEKYGMTDAKTVSTPADLSVKLEKIDSNSKAVDQTMYQSMVGSLLYAAIATRPDIAQAVGVVSKYNSNPTEAHLTAVKRVLRYLKGTMDLAIQYQPSEQPELVGYSDADWAGDLDDRHSTTGNIFMMTGGAISWLSKKQPIVPLSTAEAEYVALSAACQEAVWLRRLLSDIHAAPSGATILMEDNQGTIAIARNPIAHSRTKHIDIRYHYVREAIDNESVDVEFCPTTEMIADLLTKPLPKGQFGKLRQAMGVTTAQPVGVL